MAIVYTGKEAIQEVIAKLKAYADNAAEAAASNINLWEVVSVLPTEDIDKKKVYLVPASTTEANNIYAEYMYVNGSWEKFGEAELAVDLSDYYTKAEVAEQIANQLSSYVTTASLDTKLADYTKTTDFTEITAAEVDAMF